MKNFIKVLIVIVLAILIVLCIDYNYVGEDYSDRIKAGVIEKSQSVSGEVIEDDLYSDIYGTELDEIMKEFEGTKFGADVITDKKTFVTIIPYSDFLDNQSYYYKNGKFVAYVRDFIGVGGSFRYYFKNGKLIKIEKNIEEDPSLFQEENTEKILKAAEFVKEKYIK